MSWYHAPMIMPLMVLNATSVQREVLEIERAKLDDLRYRVPGMSRQVDQALAWADRLADESQSTGAKYTAAQAHAEARARLAAGQELDDEGNWGARVARIPVLPRREPPQGNRQQRRAEAARRRRGW